MTAHARLGASSAHRWMRCPASVRAEAGLPDEGSPAAREGTDAHELAKVCLLNGEVDASSYLDMPVSEVFGHPGASGAATVPGHWVTGVNIYLEHVWKLSTGDAERYVEERLSLEAIRPDMFGTADCILIYPEKRKVTVVDFKFGFDPVDANDNPQLQFYALAAFLRFGNYAPETIEVCIVQPRVAHGDQIKTVVFPASDLVDWMGELWKCADATDDPNAPFVAGPHCKHCKKRFSCETLKAFATAEATGGFSATSAPPHTAGDMISGEELARRFLNLETIKLYCKAVEVMAESRAKIGEKLPGLKWVRGRGAREWSEGSDATAAKIEAATGLDVREHVLPSPAQVEKVLGKKLFKTIEPDTVRKKPGSPKLVSAADDRPEISPTADDWRLAAFAPVVDG